MAWRSHSIQRAAEKLRLLGGSDQLPVPVREIAKKRGVELQEVPFHGELSGLLFQDEGRIIIGVNALHSETRKRFTIAHELGHLELHSHTDLHVDRNFRIHLRGAEASQGTEVSEIEANAFAAELLMPASRLKAEVERQTIDFEDNDEMLLERLAKQYGVSVLAMTFRLTKLGLLRNPGERP